jgi:hypothetical protein
MQPVPDALLEGIASQPDDAVLEDGEQLVIDGTAWRFRKR